MTIKNEPRVARRQDVPQALQIGAALQAVCILLPLLDGWIFGSVEQNVRSAYPSWGAGEIAADRTAIIGYLVLVCLCCLLGWLAALRAVDHGWHERAVVTALFAIGTVWAIVNAGLSGGAYSRVVPLWLGLTLLLVPLMPALTALIAVWRKPQR